MKINVITRRSRKAEVKTPYHIPPTDYLPPTACETCGRRITFVPVVGGQIWSHLVDDPTDHHPVRMRVEGYFDVVEGKTVFGNPLRRWGTLLKQSEDQKVKPF